MTYRQWLQSLVNEGGGLPAQEAQALLHVVGDDFNINEGFLNDPYAFTGNDRGQIQAGDEWYGPQGTSALNNKYQLAYQKNVGGDSPTTTTSTGGGGGTTAVEPVDPDIALRAKLRQQILGRGGDIDSAYGALFGDLDKLVKSRGSELEGQYGDQLSKVAEQYTGAIPQIETSYAAIGAADSTDTSDAKTGAKKGFDETTSTIGKNKQADTAKLGQYSKEQRAKFGADRDAAKRNVSRAGETEDVGALRQMRNDLETNLSSAGVTRATLGTDQGARGEVANLTKNAGRYEAAVNALDSILKSSMSGSVKEAAVNAITSSAGLSDEEKKKVQQQYGNVYAEQAAL